DKGGMAAASAARAVGRAVGGAPGRHAGAGVLRREVGSGLAGSLDYHDEPAPARDPPELVVDVGSGPGHQAAALQARWPKARVVAVDSAGGMLEKVRGQGGRKLNPFARRPEPVRADARALPLADRSVDVLFSNLCLQWVDDLPAVLAGFRRVLKPAGMLLISTF